MVRALLLVVAWCCCGTTACWSMQVNGQSKPPAVARWPHEARVGFFHIHADYDFSARIGFFRQLESLPRELSETLGIKISEEPIHLILFGKQSDYRMYLRTHFPDLPSRQALFIKRRGPGMVFAFESQRLEIDLRHEATHALLHASLPYVPLWLDEGLAEYFEIPAAQRRNGNPHHSYVRMAALVGKAPSIHKLEAIGGIDEMGNPQYRQAWAWVHFFLHESDQSRAVLQEFLRDLQVHSPPGSFARRVATDLPGHPQRFIKHFR